MNQIDQNWFESELRQFNMEAKQIYCIRHGESTYNEWRSKSFRTFEWIYKRDPMILDARLSTKGQQQVSVGCCMMQYSYHVSKGASTLRDITIKEFTQQD